MKDRKSELTDSLEDYLEAVFNIAGANNVARCKDIAARLNVARSSVTAAMRALARKGLVNYEPYSYVTLTDPGAQAAAKIAHKHKIITSFLEDILGVDPSTAREAACKAEHALGGDVISRLLCFMEFAVEHNSRGMDLIAAFNRFRRKRSQGSNGGSVTTDAEQRK